MTKLHEKFFIVDFTAVQRYFHQYPLIIGITRFLSDKRIFPTILLPINADREDIGNAETEVKFVLDSGYSSRTHKPVRGLLLKFLNFANKTRFSLEIIKRYLRKKYVASALLQIDLDNNFQITKIIFPTLDPLSLELAQAISKNRKMINTFFYFRIIGAETRGPLASQNSLKQLLKLCVSFPDKIKIGIETVGYKDYLIQIGFSPKLIHWSPWPLLDAPINLKNSTNNITIGFLGCAKERKGFDNIPKILEAVKNDKIDFQVLIQKANFPWERYFETKKSIENMMGADCQFLPSDLNIGDLQRFISKCSVLILPYDATSYSKNASGILYHACDSNVPILASQGVGFDFEINQFKLGFTFKAIEEIPQLINRIKNTPFEFTKYNLRRKQAVDEFYV